jgi:polar amino acid transport system substrate-binding protein
VDVITVPTGRSLINVNAGIDDGDIFRVAGAEQSFPNLIRIPGKTLDTDFVAYTKRTDIQIRNWADLKPYSVAYAAGWRPYELNVKEVKELTKTSSINELPALLEKGRADVILMDRWQGQWAIQQSGYKFHLVEPPLARFEMFMYLNKKHAALVPKAAQALADMKADGSYKKLIDQYLLPLQKP